MTKLRNPMFGFDAHGTVGESVTFQSSTRRKFARQKPIPSDPKSPDQLTQRIRYQEAVAAWNALATEEKEAWRGKCRGLTAYQCFIRSELRKPPPPPPPEEKTEEQTQYDTDFDMFAVSFWLGGQRLTIPNRKVRKLGFWLDPFGSPSGDIFFQILRLIDDSIILEKLWGDASTLVALAYCEVQFDTPLIINEEVRILVKYQAGDAGNHIREWCQLSDVKAGEHETRYRDSDGWHDDTGWDCAYRYKYYDV